MFQGICYILMALSSIIFIIFSNLAPMLLVGRIFAGLSHGICYVTVLIHAGEIAAPKLRGMIVSLVHLSLFVGVFITSSTNLQKIDLGNYFGHLEFNRLLGIIAIVFTLFGAVLMYFFHVESPMFYICKQKSQKAQDVMLILRNETEISDETRNDFEQLHRLVTEDLADGEGVLDTTNLRSLTSMICLKLAFICTFSMPVNIKLLRISSIVLGVDSIDPSALILSSARLVTLLVTMMFLDSCRRILASVSATVLTLLMLTLTISTVIDALGSNTSVMIILAYLFQISSAIGIGLHVDVYSTECYSSIKKPESIAHSVAVECVVQILLVLYHFYPVMSIHWIFAIMTGVLAFTVWLIIFKIPDTARNHLIEAKNKFYKTLK